MTTARLLMAAPGIIGLAALMCFAGLILTHARQLRREEAREAERRARPPGVQPGTAAEDAAAILRDAISPCLGCEAEERSSGVINLPLLELYPPDHDPVCPTRRAR